MRLRNKNDNAIYNVSTETDNFKGFMIFAEAEFLAETLVGHVGGKDFVMHYRSLEEFTKEWEDA